MKNLNYRKFVLLIADVFIIIVSGIVLNYALSLTKVISAEASGMLFYYLLINILTCELMLLLFGAYSRIWRYFNIRDYIMCGLGMTVGFLMGYGVLYILSMKPRKIFFILFYIVATAGVLLFRFLFKSTFLKITRYGQSTQLKRTLIVGAGQAGRMILTEISNAQSDPKNPSADLQPVCLVDDDPNKLHRKINGIEVLGVCAEIPKLCKELDIGVIIVAVPSCEEMRHPRGSVPQRAAPRRQGPPAYYSGKRNKI